MTAHIPKSPWDNSPAIDEGVYLATIKDVVCLPYRCNSGKYIRMVFWLPHVEQWLVSNFYFPAQGDDKSVKRLARLCSHLGLVPQDALDSPRDFIGGRVAVKVKLYKGMGHNEGTTYPDVELYLSADTITKDGKLAV